jgi:hypothetical protein
MQPEPGILDVGVGVQMIDTCCIDQGGTAFYAMDFITLAKEKFRKVCPVLPRDTGNQCCLAHFSSRAMPLARPFNYGRPMA